MCVSLDTYYYTIIPEDVYRIIDFGFFDKLVYDNMGITIHGKKVLKKVNYQIDPFIVYASRNNKDFTMLNERYKFLGSIELNRRIPIYQKGCLNKTVMPIDKEVKADFTIIYLFEENVYFSALKLLIVFIFVSVLISIVGKIANIKLKKKK